VKYIDAEDIDRLPGVRIHKGDSFFFRCHSGLDCFNQCCRNLNLFLYPYDVLRLKKNLDISSGVFLDKYVDVVLRPSDPFPEVMLRMAANNERTCPFLSEKGCSVYPDRPDTCRTFPIEQGSLYDAQLQKATAVHFFRPPDFCMGQHEKKAWRIDTWREDQDAVKYNQMTEKWADLRRLFHTYPWGAEGPGGNKGKMAFMACYNVDAFREFVLQSSFLKRYKIKPKLLKKLRRDDAALLELGFEWVRFFLRGHPSALFRLK
jgi:Fe-S-cluster containining protein